jgi:hypothetical protein
MNDVDNETMSGEQKNATIAFPELICQEK